MGLEQVKLLVLDFDGVLTDNHVYVDQEGRESVRCYRGDGLGIERVRNLGVEVIVLSGEVNPVVQARCDKLALPCHQGVRDKLAALKALIAWPEPIPLNQVAYVGNDVNDLECLKAVGFPFIPGDAEPGVRWPLNTCTVARHGGEGCVRQVCDLIAEAHARPSVRVPIYEPWRLRTRFYDDPTSPGLP